ncbi:uncharacterized protein [Physcomitrium patens]|uniref:NEDD8 ultimate buster 1 n=1 Tax=Physcomitrium patens TaxID=3218 RepID=A0A2K1KV21_PHYPA|nr:NEDD8 ultimate buster 1-like [Physcomitrium patens]XP_024370671.1 NEDD8 ultimate buster 1-like [Physcomitrium patens]XP_024370672.1 NEDD8 ultimate buster 1-like [Physcomitrium patens]XP_024370673.1 NEDD8 ultimate buster 1-like [Physcomitrium patens]XP_024370675.1 NEDD8 ultimate buster 1-like [Physcomitrium patens]XP_024370676.1 NEDD8 ultimate buster 1-like [Physcomitrium patens]PNR57637.1 hypothetical protein PHYPA_004631 [Physcomitrium patens]|eukprot:XP_024370670.1 NEDD8 ultimate buster 1-like [Physcomitrella patens]
MAETGTSRGDAGPSRQRVRLRVAGAWSGTLEVSLDEWSVEKLRTEVSSHSGIAKDCIKLISAGRILKDEVVGTADTRKTLRELGIGPNSKLLLTRIAPPLQTNSVDVEQERAERLARIKAAADAMSKRSDDGRFPSDEFDLQLENQSGEKLTFNSETDRRALVMGLMLHAKARSMLEQGNYQEALEVLGMSEESFSLCDRKFLEAVDNVALLQIDTVWCLFMLRDIERLSVARERLARARDGLKRSHGPNLERLRVLQGGFCPELALYVRLELLEGVVAYHSGQTDAARASLLSAQEKFEQLQISDEQVAALAQMGFSMKEARRSLRVSGKDASLAVEFVMNERAKAQQKAEEDDRRQTERREQKKYGKTVGGKGVDITKLNELASLGYERRILAEALKQSENNREFALEMLMNPTSYSTLQASLLENKRESVDSIALAELMSMGFSKDKAKKALRGSTDTTQALERLIQDLQDHTSEGPETESKQRESEVSAASASDAALLDNSISPESPASTDLDPRDEEMEEEIAREITGDPFAEYDIEVSKEGDAISEYLALLNSNCAPFTL